MLNTQLSPEISDTGKLQMLTSQQEEKLNIYKELEAERTARMASEEKVKELTKQLRETNQKLESTNAELDQFAFIASHDLQEPLRKIRMFNDFIVLKYKDKLDEEGQIYLDRMQVSCEHMQSLIKDVLTFSKIDVLKSKPELTDLTGLLAEVTADMNLRIEEKNAKITVEPLPQLVVHPNLIKLLFQQLISNAIKFSVAGTQPVISITNHITTFDDSDKMNIKRYWKINVKDNGVGFDQKYADQVFTAFKRLHGNSEYLGTGVGLAICKKIVEEHHGTIYAKSEINKGTTFTITLPDKS